MTTPQDIERLARAINPNAWVDSPYFMSDSRKWHRRESLAAVRAVLTELLNPSERMIKAGIMAMSGSGPASAETAVIFGQPKDVWQAMIRSILTEGEDRG